MKRDGRDSVAFFIYFLHLPLILDLFSKNLKKGMYKIANFYVSLYY